MPPFVSVIIPCFNCAQYLEEAVESVLSQTFTGLECIVVDDGSTDNTREVSQYLVSEDARVKYLFKTNSGMASARNMGIKYAEGEWIQFLDADDWIDKNKIDFQLNYLRRYGPKNYDEIVLYTDYELVYMVENQNILRSNPRIVGRLTNEQLLERAITWDFKPNFPLLIHSMLFRSSIFKQTKFNEEFLSYADIEFETNLLLENVPFFYTPIVGAFYRRHKTNTTRNWHRIRKYYIYYLEGIQKKNKDLLHRCPTMGRLIKETIREKDKDTFDKLVRIVSTSQIPVYFSVRKINFNYPFLLKFVYLMNLSFSMYRRVRNALCRRFKSFFAMVLTKLRS